MNVLSKYNIPYKGLSLGSHTFEFEVDDRFFQAFEHSELHRGHGRVRIELEKQSRMLSLAFDMTGEVEVACDRCLEEFMLPFAYRGTLQVRFSETEKESDGEIMWISPNETELSLAQYIYGSINLSLPYQRVHPTDAAGKSLCNADMLSRFQIVSEEEFEQIVEQASHGGGQEGENPWGALEKVKEELNKTK